MLGIAVLLKRPRRRLPFCRDQMKTGIVQIPGATKDLRQKIGIKSRSRTSI